jgi:hypothetical protein
MKEHAERDRTLPWWKEGVQKEELQPDEPSYTLPLKRCARRLDRIYFIFGIIVYCISVAKREWSEGEHV